MGNVGPASSLGLQRHDAVAHLFVDGAGRPTPDVYAAPGHVNPEVAATIASWIAGTSR